MLSTPPGSVQLWSHGTARPGGVALPRDGDQFEALGKDAGRLGTLVLALVGEALGALQQCDHDLGLIEVGENDLSHDRHPGEAAASQAKAARRRQGAARHIQPG